MQPIDTLIAADRETKKRIAVIGCSMRDVYIHGDLLPSQDGVQKFVERYRVETPGGAAGAARQLCRWNADAVLYSVIDPGETEAWNQVKLGVGEYVLARRMPEKHRFLDAQERILWRHDKERGYGVDASLMQEWRKMILNRLFNWQWDAVLISDYEKGFVDEAMIRAVIGWCNERKIPVVADAKRPPEVYEGALLKFNEDYAERYDRFLGKQVVTHGPYFPAVIGCSKPFSGPAANTQVGAPVPLVNHVGAGDCFSAHLTLALAHGLPLEEAAAIAHSAGRIYVQFPHGRPPWPHEVRKDAEPIQGKIVPPEALPALRKAIPGRLVFANGVFRVPHAGHAAMLQWARRQGDALVVGVNSEESARRLRPGYLLPGDERMQMLAAMSAVDWIVVFEEADPCAVIAALKPDVLVKGSEYEGQAVPGDGLVPEVRFAPMVDASKPARLIGA